MSDWSEEIQLRDRRTRKEILGSVEEGRSRLGFTSVCYAPGAGQDLEIDLGGALDDAWDGTETVTDDWGDRLFYDEDHKEIPERFIEPGYRRPTQL